MKHISHPNIHRSKVRVNLVGCGGTGSQVLSGLVRLHLAMQSLGHPHGLSVTAWDPDHVSRSNIGRQLFTVSEINRNKAECLIHRMNLHFGLDWQAEPRKYNGAGHADVIISCVDTAKSRAEINQTLCHRNAGPYVIDGGNDSTTAQIIIGDGSKELPLPYAVLPELIDTKADVPNRPSCSLAEALNHQDLWFFYTL